MHAFSNAQNITINGGQFTDNSTTTTININGPTGIDILLGASCPDAAHDSSARSDPPRCYPGTRQQYIEDIVNWAVPPLGDTPPSIYWMKGPAGVGKSAIAQTCSENFRGMENLGAAFFFSIRGKQNPQALFPSIAYQLSTIHPPYRRLIDEKIHCDRTLVDKAMSFQFQYLIYEPLRELASQGNGIVRRTVIIVDGLDECDGSGAQAEIIRIVAKAVSDGTLPLCWAFFSRAEPQLEATFSEPSIAAHCHNVLLPISRDADGEIELYLRNGFEDILKRRNVSLGSQWPSVEDMATLIDAVHGLWIYASTVLRFVDNLSLPGPQKRLHTIIDTILERRDLHAETGADGPFAGLDAFYTLILQRIPTEIYLSVHLLLAVICQYGPLGVIFLANILGLSREEFEIVCNHANAIVRFHNRGKKLELDPTIDTNCTRAQVSQGGPDELNQQVIFQLGGLVAFHHTSFDGFLLDPARSGRYCVKGSEALEMHYLKMHLDYSQTWCWEGSELVLVPGVTESLSCPYPNKLVNSLTKDLAYAVFGTEDRECFSALGVSGGSRGKRDFRKTLHVFACLASDKKPSLYSGYIWGCRCQCKWYPGIQIYRASMNNPQIKEFKSMVKQRKKAKIIRRYHPSWHSRVKSFFRVKSRQRFESAVYQMGQGEKSIFWYWEIDHKLGRYRDFKSIDLAEGEKRFREEDFDAWSEWSLSWSEVGCEERGTRSAYFTFPPKTLFLQGLE